MVCDNKDCEFYCESTADTHCKALQLINDDCLYSCPFFKKKGSNWKIKLYEDRPKQKPKSELYVKGKYLIKVSPATHEEEAIRLCESHEQALYLCNKLITDHIYMAKGTGDING